MKNRLHRALALVFSTGLVTAMVGCDPEETGAITESGIESAALETDVTARPEPQVEMQTFNGQCCHWRCTEGNEHKSSIPEEGHCREYAAYWCQHYGHGSLREGTASWGGC